MVMEDFNLLDYNQHQLMKRAPTLITGPSMVFLAPTKKSLRSPIIKCKIPLASLMPIFDRHQSVAHHSICSSMLLVICSILMVLCSSLWLQQSSQSLLMYLCTSTINHSWSIFSTQYTCQSAHPHLQHY